VLADVSGESVHAALLMANLQVHLRSLSGLTRGTMERMTPLDLVRTLELVNRYMWKSTAAQHSATLFFGLYDDRTRRLAPPEDYGRLLRRKDFTASGRLISISAQPFWIQYKHCFRSVERMAN